MPTRYRQYFQDPEGSEVPRSTRQRLRQQGNDNNSNDGHENAEWQDIYKPKDSVVVQENYSELSKSPPKALTGLKIFPWKKKKQSEKNQVPNQLPSSTENSTASESIPKLPTLEGLDSLSSITSSTKTKKKKKFMSGYVKKMQSVLAKS